MNLPGFRLRALAARLCSARTLERLIDPAIADLQTEYSDAVRAGRVWRRRWIWLAGHVAFAHALACYGAERAAHGLRDLTVDDRQAMRSTIQYGLIMMLVGMFALGLAPFLGLSGTFVERLRLTVYALPQLLPTAIFIAVPFGILWGLEDVSVSRRTRHLVLLLVLALSIVTFTLMGWFIPASNGTFRIAVATTLGTKPEPKAANEFTITELRRMLDPRRHQSTTPEWRSHARQLEMSYYTRWTYSCAPLVLCLFALTLRSRSRWAQRAPGIVASAAVVGHIFLWMVAQVLTFDRSIPIAAVVWMPNAVYLLMSAAVLKLGTAARAPAH